MVTLLPGTMGFFFFITVSGIQQILDGKSGILKLLVIWYSSLWFQSGEAIP
jgi:hypothetical protein